MKQESNRDEFVERVLGSLDGLERARPEPWLYTRIKGRLQRQESAGWEKISQLLARPVVAIASLGLVLVLNLFFLLQSDSPANGNSVAQGEQVVDSESLIASSSSFDFENLTP